MNILIVGGTGFIGKALVAHFLKAEHTIFVVGRDKEKVKSVFGTQVTSLDYQDMGSHQPLFGKLDIIVNLAGANIGAKRWSKARKNEILDSRIDITKKIVTWCVAANNKNLILLNASAIGVYGLQKSTSKELPPAMDENTVLDFQHYSDFLSLVGRAWEQATDFAKLAKIRVVNMRFGVVLGRSGGVLQKLRTPYLFGLGGIIGFGRQAFTWIALEDLIRAIDFLIQHPELKGPVNLVAPETVTQAQFAKAFGRALHHPAWFWTPGFILKLIFGQMADELLLQGQHVKPLRLTEAGFTFNYPTLQAALNAIMAGKTL